jgi:hypothetical protein
MMIDQGKVFISSSRMSSCLPQLNKYSKAPMHYYLHLRHENAKLVIVVEKIITYYHRKFPTKSLLHGLPLSLDLAPFQVPSGSIAFFLEERHPCLKSMKGRWWVVTKATSNNCTITLPNVRQVICPNKPL